MSLELFLEFGKTHSPHLGGIARSEASNTLSANFGVGKGSWGASAGVQRAAIDHIKIPQAANC